jgi:hypothetical protein
MPTLIDKLHPNRFSGMSGRMAAVVGYVLGQEWSAPRIVELVVTSDGWVLARNAGHVGFDTIIGTVDDLERNWKNLLSAAGLTGDERLEVGKCYAQAVRDCRRKNRKGTENHDVA